VVLDVEEAVGLLLVLVVEEDCVDAAWVLVVDKVT